MAPFLKHTINWPPCSRNRQNAQPCRNHHLQTLLLKRWKFQSRFSLPPQKVVPRFLKFLRISSLPPLPKMVRLQLLQIYWMPRWDDSSTGGLLNFL